MLIAVASAGSDVCTEQTTLAGFMCYTVERGIIVRCRNYSSPIAPGESWVCVLTSLGVDTLLVHALDQAVRSQIERQGIDVVEGFCGSIERAVQAYLSALMHGCDDDYAELAAV